MNIEYHIQGDIRYLAIEQWNCGNDCHFHGWLTEGYKSLVNDENTVCVWVIKWKLR